MDELLNILSELHPDVDFEEEDMLVDDGIIDSFDIVTIVSEIQERMDVVIGAKYITPENFNSAEAIYDLIEQIREEEA